MLIEKDARRHIIKAIEIERELKSFEIREKLKGKVVIRSSSYNQLRKQFLQCCCQINMVANSAGKGRDDLGIDILIAAEEIARKVSNLKSKAVRKLAQQIRQTYDHLRNLVRKYSENIEVVDPQLKNNSELGDSLLSFEKAWEKGKNFFLDQNSYNMLISLSRLIEGLSEKYKDIQEKFESMDTDVFIILPCLAILRSLDENDNKIFDLYYPDILTMQSEDNEAYKNMKNLYTKMKNSSDGYYLYNIIEQTILEKSIDNSKKEDYLLKQNDISILLNEIKKVAILIQRSKPAEWNILLETAMGHI